MMNKNKCNQNNELATLELVSPIDNTAGCSPCCDPYCNPGNGCKPDEVCFPLPFSDDEDVKQFAFK